MAEWIAWAAPAAALVGLAVAAYLGTWVLKQDPGNEKMQEISQATQEGAMAFLKAEWRVLIIFAIGVFAVLTFSGGSLIKGLLTGLRLRHRRPACQQRPVTSACTSPPAPTRVPRRRRPLVSRPRCKVAFRSGLTMGLTVASFGVFGLGLWVIFMILRRDAASPRSSTASRWVRRSIALFARVGGGIYTKAADVGADLVGKVEAGIPEDDPRNPAVIADNVGDNVGDVAGMGADLYESYVGSIVAPIVLALTLWGVRRPISDVMFGVIDCRCSSQLRASSAASSVCLRFAPRRAATSTLPLNTGTYVAAALEVVAMFGLFYWWGSSTRDGSPVVLRLGRGRVSWPDIAIGQITEYYCSDHYKPVKSIAEASLTGPATNIIAGLGVGMISTVGPILVVAAGIWGAYTMGNLAVPCAGDFGHLRHRACRARNAVVRGLHDRRRRLRSCGGQRGRYRGDGSHAEGDPRDHRQPRLGGQHDGRHRQGLRDRVGRPVRPRAVHGVSPVGRGWRHHAQPVARERARHRGSVPRRDAAVPVRRTHDERGGSRGLQHDR